MSKLTPEGNEEIIDSPLPKKSRRDQVKTVVVVVFVVWHLTFLIFRNVDSLLDYQKFKKFKGEHPTFAGYYDPLEKWTTTYEKKLGLDQGWRMFTSPIAQSAPFPAVRLEFADGTTELVLSDNEPENYDHFVRWGRARLRKYEHHIVVNHLYGTYKEPLWKQYCRWRYQVWKSRHPDDRRRLEAAVLLKRIVCFPDYRGGKEKDPDKDKGEKGTDEKKKDKPRLERTEEVTRYYIGEEWE